jgi:hypothetical protein
MPKTVEIDVIPPRNFSKGLPMKEVRDLFVPFIEGAGLQGKFTIRCENLAKGSSGKASTIRFKWRPAAVGASFEVIHVNFQCHKPDMCFDALLIPQDLEVSTREVYQKLNATHSAHCFVLAHHLARKSSASLATDPSILWTSTELQEAALNRICDIAVIDKDTFIKRFAIEDIANDLFGKEINWGEGGMAEHLVKAGMLEPFDGAGIGPTQRLFVEAIAFETIGRKHPDTIRREGGHQPPPPDPVPPTIPTGDFLAQIRNARRIIATHMVAKARLEEIEKEGETVAAEMTVLEAEIAKLTRSHATKVRRQNDLNAEKKGVLATLNDPAYKDAEELVSEIRALTAG